MDVMACRFCFVSRGFNRRRRSLQEALVSVVGCRRGWAWGRNHPQLASSREERRIGGEDQFYWVKVLTAHYRIEHLPLLWNSGECSCVLMMFTACFGGVPEGGREVRGRSSLTCVPIRSSTHLPAKATVPSMDPIKYCFLYTDSLKAL